MSAIWPRHSAERTRALLLVGIVIWLAAALSTGCAVKLIGDYDATIDVGVSDVQQRAEVYLGKLKANPSTPYDPNFYNDYSRAPGSAQNQGTVVAAVSHYRAADSGAAIAVRQV